MKKLEKALPKLDMKKLSAQFGYTLDGGEAGSLEDETFSADGATIIINGVIAHPGYAKGKLVNALKIAGEILHALPKDKCSPESTEKREGFIHPVHIEGNAEKATIEFILRDFDLDKLKGHAEKLRRIAGDVVSKYPGATMDFTIHEQYRNMKEILDKHPQVAGYAAEAIKRAGLKVKTESIRGGTDGSRLKLYGFAMSEYFYRHAGHSFKAGMDRRKRYGKSLQKQLFICV